MLFGFIRFHLDSETLHTDARGRYHVHKIRCMWYQKLWQTCRTENNRTQLCFLTPFVTTYSGYTFSVKTKPVEQFSTSQITCIIFFSCSTFFVVEKPKPQNFIFKCHALLTVRFSFQWVYYLKKKTKKNLF